MFAWGCEGWGSSTRELKRAFADVERFRGFGPPLLVDIRLKRQGRAPEFQQDKFERLIGKNKYRWLPALGNKNIGTKKKAELADTSVTEELLGMALARAYRKQRVIFFCSCGQPKSEGRECHRVLVRRKLLRLAAMRNVSLDIEEWPGSYPQRLTLPISDEQADKLSNSTKAPPIYLTLRRRPNEEILGMSWASVVTFMSPSQTFSAIADPAIVHGGAWKIRLPFGIDDTSIKELMTFAQRSNKTYGFIL